MARTDAFEVLIAGGGLVGATLALAMSQGGVAVALIDASDPAAPPDPRASLVASGAWRMWRTLGVAEPLTAFAQPILALQVEHRDRGLTLAAAEIADDPAREPDEPLGWMVPNAAAGEALIRACDEAGVRRVAGSRVTAARTDARSATLTLDDGGEFTAPLAVGAEGRRSVVRDAAGIAFAEHGYGQTAISATLALARPHGGVARQLFDPAGPLALLPLTGERANLVWSLSDAAAKALIGVPVGVFEAHLNRRLAPSVGAVALIGERRGFALLATRAEHLVATRTALVGEAAHGLHPIAGQGLNLGLKDAAALAEVLIDARRLGEDLGGPAVLDRYARWRRPDALATTAGVGGAARLFAARGPLQRPLATAALAVTAASSRLRRGFMNQAGAAAGDAPRLLRGLRP